MKKPYRITLAAALLFGAAGTFAQEAQQAEEAEQAETAMVFASEGALQRCMLPVVVTSIDGEEVTEGSDSFELEAGSHTITGYGYGDASQCATFSGDDGLPVPGEDARVGESTLKLDLEAGKKYFLGIDVRSKDTSNWKLVVWKLIH